ncbi:carboxypeptidase-like regulatory domain-containing protein [Marinifilum fragile]|uniref:TonB-dependent receptor n=1 Tax=Marinifilum fragile TaxID=570161 RepID=UPI002AA60A98|nr:carboxypeptidase-like regulatory domain-containing protein [Marinifilum fragile]
MKILQRLLFVIVMIVFSGFTFAQTTITGVVLDAQTKLALPGANVVVKGTTQGTTTDINGKFTLNVEQSTGQLVISFIGYESMTMAYNVNQSSNLGEILLGQDSETLADIVVVGYGVTDIAKDRQTPVAVTTIKTDEIVEKVGNQEFPEVMKTVPSVFVVKGGGYGDAEMTVRGFEQKNTAVLINGQPVNDMEWGGIYWSNWSGLQDIASAVQVQRGLGSSKLAISSVGGTVNIVTKATEREAGGFVKSSFGNDGYQKYTAAYSTGLNEKGWGATVLLSHWQGDGYMDATEGKGQTYFFSLGYKPSEQHQFNFMITGAPQWHHQDYQERISTYQKYGMKYNSNWGYKNGKVFNFSRNFYHKPVTNFNWDWNINEKTSLSTVGYASWGLGGGTGTLGTPHYLLPDDENGLIRVDDLIKANSGQTVDGFNAVGPWDGSSLDGKNSYWDGKRVVTERDGGTIRRASMNSHSWYGLVSNINHKFNENWTADFGIDLRTYRGLHYRVLTDLLGADAYYDNTDVNSAGNFVTFTVDPKPWDINNFKKATKIDRNFDSKIKWTGFFGQLEYTNTIVSAFVQASASNQKYKRYEYMEIPSSERESSWENKWGYNIKGGMNWNIDEKHNVYFNTGYYSRQPFFSDAFPNSYTEFANVYNDLDNEGIFGLEFGYGFKTQYFTAKVNAYRTQWKDRFNRFSDSNRNFARALLDQLHKGVELEFVARPTTNLKVFGLLSYGDWKYQNNSVGLTYDELGNPLDDDGDGKQDETMLYLKDVEVGGAPQFSSRLGADYKITQGLSVDADWYFYDKMFAYVDPEDYDTEGSKNLEYPNYSLFDAGVSYKWYFEGGQSLRFRFNVNNLFDTEYISRGYSARQTSDDPSVDTYKGVRVDNTVEFGFGRTWNASLTFKF